MPNSSVRDLDSESMSSLRTVLSEVVYARRSEDFRRSAYFEMVSSLRYFAIK